MRVGMGMDICLCWNEKANTKGGNNVRGVVTLSSLLSLLCTNMNHLTVQEWCLVGVGAAQN